MKTVTTSAIGIIAILAAVICGVINLKSDVKPESDSEDRQNSYDRPMLTESNTGEEHKLMTRRERVRSPESEFLRYLSKIEPITSFEEPRAGYFEAYLLVREAESLLKQSEHADNKKAVFESFEKSYAYFLGVQKTAPDWKDEMVLNRLELTKKSLKDAYFVINMEKGNGVSK